jgi:flagellar biogenesis protein FliO
MNATPTPANMNVRAPAAPVVTTNPPKPATNGMARFMNLKMLLIILFVLLGAYMAWPIVFPTKPSQDPVKVVETTEEETDDASTDV